VLAQFPPDTSPLQDLTLDSSDDSSVFLTAVLLTDSHVSSADLEPTFDALSTQFSTLNIPQAFYLNYSGDGGADGSSPDSAPPSVPSTPPSSPPASGPAPGAQS
jgi:hypothetical protein